MINEANHIKELYDLNHRHDSPVTNNRFDYENKLHIQTFSRSMFKNADTKEFNVIVNI
jgi:hypothetical protein